MEGEEGMCGCEGLYFLTLRLQKTTPKGTPLGVVADNSFPETTADSSLPGVVRFGAVWKCFLLHSYHLDRFILKSNLLTGLCADCDRGTMLIKKRAQKQEITSLLVPQTCLTTCLGSAFRPLGQFGLSDLREIL